MADKINTPARLRFANGLATARKRAHNPETKRRLTQTEMALALMALDGRPAGVNVPISNRTVSDWEQCRRGIDHDNRPLLTSLLTVLAHYGGISSLADANELLLSGHYHRLTWDEIEQVEHAWLADAHYLQNRSAHGEAHHAGERKSAIELTGQAAVLLNRLIESHRNNLIVITGLPGSGKSTLASVVFNMLRSSDVSKPLLWIQAGSAELTVPEDAYEQILQQLHNHIPNIKLYGLEHIEKSVKEFCQKQSGLIVIDNLPSLAACSYICDKLSAFDSQIAFLLTAREAPVRPFLYNHQIQQLTPRAANIMLNQTLDSQVKLSAHMRSQLLDAAGGLPWAILQVGSQLADGVSAETLLTALHQGKFTSNEATQAYFLPSLWNSLLPEQKQLLLAFQLFSRQGAPLKPLSIITKLPLNSYRHIEPLIRRGIITSHPLSNYAQLQPIAYAYIESLVKQQPLFQAQLIILCEEALSHWLKQVSNTDDATLARLEQERASMWRTIRFALNYLSKLSEEAQAALAMLGRTMFNFVYARGHFREWLPLLAEITANLSRKSDENGLRLPSNLGLIARFAGDIPQALSAHTNALKLAYRLENGAEIAQSHYNLGVCHDLAGDLNNALENGEQSLRYFAERKDNSGIAHCHNLLGLVHLTLGKFNIAETHLNSAATYHKKAKLPAEQARSLYSLGRLFFLQNQFGKAERRFAKADVILLNSPNPFVECYGNIMRARMMMHRHHYVEAHALIANLGEPQLIAIGNSNLQAMFLNTFGEAALQLGFRGQAEQLLTKSDQLLTETTLVIERAHVQLNLAKLALSRNERRRCRQHQSTVSTLLKSRPLHAEAHQIHAQLQLLRIQLKS